MVSTRRDVWEAEASLAAFFGLECVVLCYFLGRERRGVATVKVSRERGLPGSATSCATFAYPLVYSLGPHVTRQVPATLGGGCPFLRPPTSDLVTDSHSAVCVLQ